MGGKFNIFSYQQHTNQNYTWISHYLSQNGHYKKTTSAGKGWMGWWLYTAVEMCISATTAETRHGTDLHNPAVTPHSQRNPSQHMTETTAQPLKYNFQELRYGLV